MFCSVVMSCVFDFLGWKQFDVFVTLGWFELTF